MDAVGKIATSFNAEALKEPRGFIKILQWVLSIFAFATTTSVNTELKFNGVCSNKTKYDPRFQTIQVAYPFDLANEQFITPVCFNNNHTEVVAVNFMDSEKSSAEFYVFVGVIVFLYCLAALILYVFFDDQYRKHNALTIADFVTSCVITALWLISSSAWAQGLVNLKYYTDLNESGVFDKYCKGEMVQSCVQTVFPNFGSLNASIIFGFLNMVVWGGNLWFLYKETPWFKVSSKPPTTPGMQQETDPQRI